MNYIVNRIDLDVHDAGAQAWINVRQNETNRKICIALTESGEPFALTEDCDAVFAGTKPDATVFFNSCEIIGNTIEYVLTGQNLAQTGDLKCEIRLYGSGNTLICSPRFVVHVQENAVDDNGIESSDEFSELTELIGDARAATDAANASVITGATASVDSNVGTPEVELTLTQEENGQSMDFEFHNLKGETGDPGVHVGDTAPTNPAISLWIDTDDNGASQVLSVMGTFASLAALQAAVTNPNNGDSYGVGAAAPYDIYRYDAASGEWINYGNYKGADAVVDATLTNEGEAADAKATGDALAGKANMSTITNSGDLNEIKQAGIYYIMSGVSNKPTFFDGNPYGVLVVGINASGSYVVQTFYAARPGNEGIAQRVYYSGSWRDWKRLGDVHTDTNLAWVENGTTASRAYSVGDYVTINGVLCKITAAVANGGTLTSGTNYTAVGGGGGLNDFGKSYAATTKTGALWAYAAVSGVSLTVSTAHTTISGNIACIGISTTNASGIGANTDIITGLPKPAENTLGFSVATLYDQTANSIIGYGLIYQSGDYGVLKTLPAITDGHKIRISATYAIK